MNTTKAFLKVLGLLAIAQPIDFGGCGGLQRSERAFESLPPRTGTCPMLTRKALDYELAGVEMTLQLPPALTGEGDSDEVKETSDEEEIRFLRAATGPLQPCA